MFRGVDLASSCFRQVDFNKATNPARAGVVTVGVCDNRIVSLDSWLIVVEAISDQLVNLTGHLNSATR